MTAAAYIDEDTLGRLKGLLDAMDRRDRLGDAANDDFFEELWERPHLMGTLATMAPKAGETWTEGQLALWLRTVEGMARLVYKMDAAKSRDERDELPSLDDHGAIFKARYIDVLLLACEAKVEEGRTPDWPLCDRIERCLDRWVLHGPWLSEESPTLRVRANREADRLEQEPPPPDDEAQEEAAEAPTAEEEPEAEVDDSPGAWLAREPYPGPLWRRIPEALREAGRPLTKDELYEVLNQRQGVGAKLAHMVKGGEVTLDDGGRYALVEDEEQADDPEDGDEPPPQAEGEEKQEEPVEDFSDTAPVHTKTSPAGIPEHLQADADQLVNLCAEGARSIPKLADATGIDRKDAKRLVQLLVKDRRLEAYGSETEGAQSRAKYRVPPTLEEQGVTVRHADLSGALEGRILAALDNAVLPLTTKRLSALLVTHRDEVFDALQPLLERDAVVAGATGWSLPGKEYKEPNGNGKSASCQVPDCVRAAEPGSQLCQDHGAAVARL